jgi:nitronate monooxygenase
MEQKNLPVELPETSDVLAVEELVELLNTLLEAERAGAKVLAAFLEEYPHDSKAWNQLRQLQQDEAHNCAILMNSIRSLGKVPSSAVGEFVNKALAIQGRVPRLTFLNRGQAWVARKIAEALPRILPGPVHQMLHEMRESHIANIEACDALLIALDDTAA